MSMLLRYYTVGERCIITFLLTVVFAAFALDVIGLKALLEGWR